MRANRWMGIVMAAFVVVGLLVIWNPASPGQAPAAQGGTVWEYETFQGNIRGANTPLKELGQQGWELCIFNPKEELYIFKRPKK